MNGVESVQAPKCKQKSDDSTLNLTLYVALNYVDPTWLEDSRALGRVRRRVQFNFTFDKKWLGIYFNFLPNQRDEENELQTLCVISGMEIRNNVKWYTQKNET